MNYCPYCMNKLTENRNICPECGRNTTEYQHPDHALRQGILLHNRYLIGGVIGEGGFGITYIGMDVLLQYRVAIKEFFPNGMVSRNNTASNEVRSIQSEQAKEYFPKGRKDYLREARILAMFTDEPGIASVRDFFEENNTVYIVMEYLDGVTLKDYLKQVGTISEQDTVQLLMPVLNSLKKVHEKKLIHRDISPDNIMIVGDTVKLLDFGAARDFADEKSLSVIQKQGYTPMEQYRKHGAQGAWTDVYAICATIYKCITGNTPPGAPDRVFEDELDFSSVSGVSINPAFEAVLRHGMAIKPDERIQDIEELLEELSSIPELNIQPDGTTVHMEENHTDVLLKDSAENVPAPDDSQHQLPSEKMVTDAASHPADLNPPQKIPSDTKKEITPPEGENVSADVKKPKPHKIGIIIGAAVLLFAVGIGIFLLRPRSGQDNPVSESTPSGLDSSTVSAAAVIQESISEGQLMYVQNDSAIDKAMITQGEYVTVKNAASGGKNKYQFACLYKKETSVDWHIVGDGFTDADSVQVKLSSPSVYQIKSVAVDENGLADEKVFRVEVKTSEPTVLTNASFISTDQAKAGEKVLLTGAAMGGTAPYQYYYGYRKTNSSQWTYIKKFTEKRTVYFTMEDDFCNIVIVVRDANGDTAEKTFDITPGKDPEVQNASYLSDQVIRFGDSVTIHGAASGGQPDYKYKFNYCKLSSYNWQDFDYSDITDTTADFTPEDQMPYLIKVRAEDADRKSSEKIFVLFVE